MRYVVFLRGINVGGNRKIEMPRLAAVCQREGCSMVQTYINSGNVMLESSLAAPVLIERLEAAIHTEFGLDVPVVVRTAQSIMELAKSIPADWTNDSSSRTDVMFLWPSVDHPGILSEIPAKPGLESFMYQPGAVVWHVPRQNVTRSGGLKLVGAPLYQKMTVRNINTVRKLAALVQA